jgi:hypothetical protein
LLFVNIICVDRDGTLYNIFAVIPFPNLFPPPEIWDKVPPWSDRKRRIGALREAGIIAVAGTAILGAVSAGLGEVVDTFYKPAQTTRYGITKECVIDPAPRSDAASFILRIAMKEDPIGTKLVNTVGPVSDVRVVTGKGRPAISGDGLGKPQHAANLDDGSFAFSVARFPEGADTYNVHVTHEVTAETYLGSARLAGPTAFRLADPCGRVAVTVHDGRLAQISVIEQ